MRNSLRASLALVPLVAAAAFVPTASAAPAAAPAPLTAAQAALLSRNVGKKVIVVLKDQIPQAPASPGAVHTRRDIVAVDQHAILTELVQTKARNVHSYTTINAVAATVSPGEEARLASNPSVAKVVPDQLIKLAHPFGAQPRGDANSGRTPVAGTCPAKNAPPLLEPQALQTMHVNSPDPQAKTARALGFDGAGVTVGFIADGLDINNTDFIRADGSHVFVDYKDFSGEGTNVPTGGGEAFLDASSVAAQGRNVYDIAKYSALPLKGTCRIRIEGVAPGANLVGLSIFGAEDAGFNSSFLQAIDYAVAVDHVNVLNESLGENFYPDDQASLDLIKQANDQAVAAGTTVTVSSGDAGVTNTTGTPSTDPNVIAVGASTTYQLPVQIGYGGSQFGVTGWLDNNISSLSSSGFEQDGTTISLVAPGELNWALCSTDIVMYADCTDFNGNASPVQESGGTSESAPLTAGAAALVIQAYRATHHGATPTPALVKQFLTSTADDIYAPADAQGAGLVNAYRAVLAARAYKAPLFTAQTPATLVESSSQFNAITPPNTSTTFTEQLTNVGSAAEQVDLSTRTLGAYTNIKTTTVKLSDTASGHSVDYQGFVDNYEVVHFSVPNGFDRLSGSIAFQGASAELSARVRLALVDPTGKLADYSLPQGIGNYGNAQVAKPAAGTWTAYIWGRGSADGGTTGKVLFGASVANYTSFGTVSPAHLTIAAGATRSVTLAVTSPSTPGDLSGSLVIASTGQTPLAVPVTLRSLAPSGATQFSGVLSGGNGREITTGVAAYYQLDIPAGRPAFNASVTLADNPNNQLFVWLIDPAGQAQAFQSNGLVTADKAGNLSYTNTLGANVHVLNPAGGRWTVIINFAPTVSGTALQEGYTVSLNQRANSVSAIGVPNGKGISSKHPTVMWIKVTNTGTAPEAYFVDGRTNATASYDLAPFTAADTTVPLTVADNIPFYIVPSETTSITGTATTTGATPIQFDLAAPSGDPDVASGVGSSVSATVTGNPVSAGLWDLAPTVAGAFGPTGAAREPVTTTLTAQTKAFDPAVTSATGDLWQSALGGPIDVSPIIVQPGHSTTIPVFITPSGPAGTTVSGVLYLDDDSLFSSFGDLSPNANTVAAIPYSYTISH
jgi:hypothetical protein